MTEPKGNVSAKLYFFGAWAKIANTRLSKEFSMDFHQQYVIDSKKIKEVNTGLLVDFETWLTSLGLAPKTAAQHVSNIDFYINEFLLYEDAIEAAEGVHEISMFFGDWFIRKAMWASPGSIKNNAASIKKFYAFMLTKELVDKQALAALAQTIKEEMPAWIAQVQRYDQDLSEMDDEY